MVGYMGDARAEKAHIIIRRRQLDSASNDIGFARDGNVVYQALISEYDRGIGFNHAWLVLLNCRSEFVSILAPGGARRNTST